MDCPFCGDETRVVRTTTLDPDKRLIVRERQCAKGTSHRFVTEEQERIAMVDVGVQQSGNSALKPYSRQILERALRDSLFVGATPKQEDISLVANLLDRVEHKITRRAVRLRRITDDEKAGLLARSDRMQERDANGADALRAIRVVVNDRDIEAAVDHELAQSAKTRSHRVLYALTVQGRQGNVTTHPGWKDAGQVIDWLTQAFPTLSDQARPERVAAPAQEVSIPALREQPSLVLKKDQTRDDFDLGRFRRAVAKALKGRRDESLKVDGIVWATLARLNGQKIVQSSQLSITALELLRSTDEVGYLRAAVRIKGLTSVTEIFSEATALLTHPAPRLIFTPPTTQIILPETI